MNHPQIVLDYSHESTDELLVNLPWDSHLVITNLFQRKTIKIYPKPNQSHNPNPNIKPEPKPEHEHKPNLS